MSSEQAQTNNNETKVNWLQKTKEIIGILTSISLILVAALWVIGRQYYGGFFTVLNISSNFLNYSIWEYGEQGWVYLAFIVVAAPFYLFVAFSVTGFIVFAMISQTKSKIIMGAFILLGLVLLIFAENNVFNFISALSIFLSCILGFNYDAKNKKQDNSMKTVADYYIKSISLLLLLLSPILVILPLYFALLQARETGIEQGYNRVGKEEVLQMHIVTSKVIPNLTPVSISPSGNGDKGNEYTYTGLNLLLRHNEYYFLFDTIDPSTCKPKNVYFIKEEFVQSAHSSPIPALAPNCQPPTPTPLTSATPTALSATPSLPITPSLPQMTATP